MQATIHNEFLTLTVDTHGAEAVSLKNAAGQEMLWQADPAVWKRHAPILFPWTGKLTGGAFTHKGKTYPGGQHGFHLHDICVLCPVPALTAMQSPWAAAVHRTNLTLTFPGGVKCRVRSVKCSELPFLLF